MSSVSPERSEAIPDFQMVLDIAADIVVNDGFDAVSLNLIAARADISLDDVTSLFETREQLLISMLNREYTSIYRDIFDNIERDPLGGRMSRIYRYVLSAAYERPVARAMYLLDRDGLNRIMKGSQGFSYVPQLRVRTEFIQRMQRAGTVRADVNPSEISAVVSAVSAGTALTAPYGDLDKVTAGLATILERAVDTDLADTSAGKAVFFEYASSLANGRPEH